MSTLIVRLPQNPADTAALYDYVLAQDGKSVGEYSRAPVGLLPQAGTSSPEVVAVVPARKLSWHQTQLPRGTLKRGFLQKTDASHLRAVLEGLLEDQLLDETAHLHFALQPQPRTEAPVWVAVCDRDWLRAGLRSLEQAGRPVARVVPEFAPDALTDTLHVIGEPDDGYLVFPADGGVAVWPLSATSVAQLNWPAQASVVAEPAVAHLAEQLLQRAVTLQPVAHGLVQAIESAWDLAQFDLVNSNSTRTWNRLGDAMTGFAQAPRWRAARIALLALLAINLVGLNAWAWRERAELDSKRATLRTILTTTFPQVRVVVDAPLQMAKEVALLQRASGTASGHDLETMLSAFGAVAPAIHPPDVIDFVPGEIRMKGYKFESDQIAQIALKLRPQGYVVNAESNFLIMKQASHHE